jgi:hypothetical protein
MKFIYYDTKYKSLIPEEAVVVPDSAPTLRTMMMFYLFLELSYWRDATAAW